MAAASTDDDWMQALVALFADGARDAEHPYPAVLVPAGTPGTDGAVVAVFQRHARARDGYSLAVLQHFGVLGDALSRAYGSEGRHCGTLGEVAAELRRVRALFVPAEPAGKRRRGGGGGGAVPMVAYCGGASRGNPGPAAYGFALFWRRSESSAAQESLEEHSRGSARFGMASSSAAEYHGAIEALRAARAAGARDVELRTDSALLVRQALGHYQIKAPHLRTLCAALLREAGALTSVRFVHVSRERNQLADALANDALAAK
jgi:ribonuclease HI